jgi:hypothetical protein
MRKTFFYLVFFLSSCGVYNNSFDCPAGRGVGCKSVSEVIDMIVEVEDGEDIFVEDQGTAALLREREKEKSVKTTNKTKKRYFLVKDDKGELVLAQELQEGKK